MSRAIRDMKPGLAEVVDWTRPWLAPLMPTVAPIFHRADWQGINEVSAQRGLLNHRNLPLRFVPQSDLPAGTAYEEFISRTGCIPTRENLHDFFNALVWLTFPHIKAQLNALHADEISRTRASADPKHTRGKLRDAATIFDENGALIVARDQKFIEALCEHRWRHVFVEGRASFGRNWDVWLFGHALMEKLVTPYKAITAHALPIVADNDFFAMPFHDKAVWIDRIVSKRLTNGVATAELTPLPILGVPGWWHDQDDVFYGDAAVFRPKRVRGPDEFPK